MKKLGKDLEFISWIKRDGTGVVPVGTDWEKSGVDPNYSRVDWMDEEEFEVFSLSATFRTFVAVGVCSWIVRLKTQAFLTILDVKGIIESCDFCIGVDYNGKLYPIESFWSIATSDLIINPPKKDELSRFVKLTPCTYDQFLEVKNKNDEKYDV